MHDVEGVGAFNMLRWAVVAFADALAEATKLV